MLRFSGYMHVARLVRSLFCVLMLPAASFASDVPSTAQIDRLEAYLNSLRTIEARFMQHNPDGSYAEGKLYLQRPGRMRFEYDPPVPLQLYAEGNILTHVDTELEQVSRYPLDESPAHFLLRERISLREGLTIKTFERQNNVIRLELADNRSPNLGSVTLTISEQPMQIRSWTVTDAQGLRTDLALVEAQFGGKIDQNVFTFVDNFKGAGN